MSKQPWFKLWAADYLTDANVQKLPLEAQGLLVRMWCACWIHGSLPAEPEEIAILTQCRTQWVSQWVTQCLTYFENRDGKLFSPRMEKERAKAREGKKWAEKRWGQQDSENGNQLPNNHPNGLANAKPNAHIPDIRMPDEKQSQSQNLLLNGEPVERESACGCSAIYKAYPRHVGPKPAKKAIEKAVKELTRAGFAEYTDKTGDLVRVVLPNKAASEVFLKETTEEFAQSPKGQLGQFVPYPATWFNSGNYIADRQEWYRNGTNGTGKQSEREARREAILEKLVGSSD